jgi:hypothetical protein
MQKEMKISLPLLKEREGRDSPDEIEMMMRR